MVKFLRVVVFTVGLALGACNWVCAEASAQSSLDIRGTFSITFFRGKVSFKVGELTNAGSPGSVSGRIEVAVWLSKQPYPGSGQPDGMRLAKCRVEGVAGGESVVNLSCSAKIRPIKRGKYYIIVTASELEASSSSFLVRDSYTFSKRLRL